jgi:hypothetical protein
MWKLLSEKGKFASIIGLITALPANAYTIVMFFQSKALTEPQLITIVVLNIIGWGWFILPSAIKIKGSKFELEVID